MNLFCALRIHMQISLYDIERFHDRVISLMCYAVDLRAKIAVDVVCA